MRYLGAILVLLFLPVSLALASPDIEEQARKVEGLLMAPCCGGSTLAEHYSGPAMRMKQEIRDMLAEGRSRQEILDHYAAQHGTQILAMPPARGFNSLAYLLPLLLLIVGTVGVFIAMRRWQRAAPSAETALPVEPIEPEYAERLARALKSD